MARLPNRQELLDAGVPEETLEVGVLVAEKTEEVDERKQDFEEARDRAAELRDKAAEQAVADSTTASHFLERARAVLEGREIDWEVEVDEDSDPVPVCWEKPSGHGVSAVHLTADGEETICGNRVRTDRPKVDPDEQNHACGHCFK